LLKLFADVFNLHLQFSIDFSMFRTSFDVGSLSYKPGVKVTQSVSANSFVTKDPFLLDKYKPDYKNGIEA
ncbi:MAG: hypothetical protein LUE92_16675, partial [Clostridiales bacterium]|nr:hypothetical protein [Clostridiales bacterium]